MPEEEQKLEDLRQEFLNHDHDGLITPQVDILNLFGKFEVVNSIPTGKPYTIEGQIKLFVNGSQFRLYWYDTVGDSWKTTVQYLQAVAIDFTTDATIVDAHHYFHIPAALDGVNLIEVHAEVITAGTTGLLTIQVADITQSADMLSTKLTIDSGETGSDTAATPAVIDTTKDNVAENDVIRIDVDTIHTGTASKGLIITLGFA